MDIYRTPAIIMRVRELGESDLLVSFFTPEKGRMRGVAKGARRSRKRFINCLDSLSCVNFEIEMKRGRELHLLHGGRLVSAFPGLRSDFTHLSKASYMVELTENLFPWGVGDPRMFQLLKDALQLLDRGEMCDLIPVIFEAKAMRLGGFGINLATCCKCGREYRGQGAAVFRRERGAIACLRCHHESAISPRISPEAVKLMKRILAEPISMLSDFHVTDEMIREIKPILKLHREYRLEKRLQTSKYVDE